MLIPSNPRFIRLATLTILTATIAVSFASVSSAQDNANQKSSAQGDAIIPEVQAMIDEWTENIRIDQMLKQGNPALTSKHSLALDYLNRGKVYGVYTRRQDLAVKDFTKSIELFKGTLEGEDWVIHQRATEAFLYRALARIDQDKHALAEPDATEAIKGFADVFKRFDHCESMLVYALQTRIKARSRDTATQQDLIGAVEDCDRAIASCKHIVSETTEQQEFFTKQVKEFETTKQELAKRKTTAQVEGE